MSSSVAHTGKKKSWREIHREQKEQRKIYREQNLLKKLEKQNKRDEQERQRAEKDIQEKLTPAVSTLSIAVPGSILENAQSEELRTYLAGQIARAACIFKVDEIIVFDDLGEDNAKRSKTSDTWQEDGETKNIRHCCLQLARILQYLECPQYLRKFFFPLHKDLKYTGLLNPLDAPHHLRQQSEFIYREGVVSGKPPKQSKGSYINIGLLNDCLVDKILTPGLRVTIKLELNQDLKSKKIRGKIVSPLQPRLETGVYWGYTVRIAKSFSDIFTKSQYENGYDLTIGTSDKGTNIHSLTEKSLKFNHALIVYGGVLGLNAAIENDENLDVDDPSLLFDNYINVAPNQGSRTIRTEEAILISLAALDEKMQPQHEPKVFDLSHQIARSEDTGIKQPMKFHGKRNHKQMNYQHSNQHESTHNFTGSFEEDILTLET
ncbi:putative methyltransferase C9orf114 [Contarinia nasturtii]|uniref:putative methyltransferase C9orf114 n=1 Tax=Contarinia nasturtii TaxID=265458 RepID=UPI0012D37BE3|nr:putative methyltransferase C9orf114 [Contarinia nasturtii]